MSDPVPHISPFAVMSNPDHVYAGKIQRKVSAYKSKRRAEFSSGEAFDR